MSNPSKTSTGDVFRDLGFEPAESAELRRRSELLAAVQEAISGLSLTQTEVAAVLRIDQPRVSNLVKGRLDLFSLDFLAKMLDRLGQRIEMSIEPRAFAFTSSVVLDTPTFSWSGSFYLFDDEGDGVSMRSSAALEKRLGYALAA